MECTALLYRVTTKGLTQEMDNRPVVEAYTASSAPSLFHILCEAFCRHSVQCKWGTTNATLPSLPPSNARRCACLGVSDVYFVGGGGTAGEDRNDKGRYAAAESKNASLLAHPKFLLAQES